MASETAEHCHGRRRQSAEFPGPRRLYLQGLGSIEEFRVGFLICGVTAAGSLLQARAIDDRDIAALIVDQALAPQRRRSNRNADPAHAEHVRQELMCELKAIGPGAILRHQQPAGEAWTQAV